MKIGILRKFISSMITAVILSIILVFVHGYAPFLVYFMYSAIGCLIIGMPCSILAEFIVMRVKQSVLRLSIGLALHLFPAGIIVLLLSFDEPGGIMVVLKYGNIFVYSIITAATVLWLVDAVLKIAIKGKEVSY